MNKLLLYSCYKSGLRARNTDPSPHERIAVLGISGLGYLWIQYSKVSGIETIAITHPKDKEELTMLEASQVLTSRGCRCDTCYQRLLQAND